MHQSRELCIPQLMPIIHELLPPSPSRDGRALRFARHIHRQLPEHRTEHDSSLERERRRARRQLTRRVAELVEDLQLLRCVEGRAGALDHGLFPGSDVPAGGHGPEHLPCHGDVGVGAEEGVETVPGPGALLKVREGESQRLQHVRDELLQLRGAVDALAVSDDVVARGEGVDGSRVEGHLGEGCWRVTCYEVDEVDEDRPLHLVQILRWEFSRFASSFHRQDSARI